MMRELGIDARWEVAGGPPEFFRVTKAAFHNGIQGLPVSLKARDFDLHVQVNRENAERLIPGGRPTSWCTIHSRCICRSSRRPAASAQWIWRCHVDASEAITRCLEASGGCHCSLHGDGLLHGRFLTRPLPCPMFIVPPSIDRCVGQELSCLERAGASRGARRGSKSTRSGR